MNLMDCFNTFQKVSKVWGFSANARSLYFAILGEFNAARYPEVLYIPNALLRDMSGINLNGKSDSSFQSARNALQNAGLIKHKNQVYKLTPDVVQEKLVKRFGELLETPCNELRDCLETAWRPVGDKLEVSRSINTTQGNSVEVESRKYKVEEPIKKEARTREENLGGSKNGAPPQGQLNLPSAEVLEKWVEVRGAKLGGSQLVDLVALENAFGAEAVKTAMETASIKNNYEEFPRVWYSRFKKILEDQLKGEKTRNDTRRNAGGAVRNTSAGGIARDDDFNDDAFKRFYGLDE